MCGTSVSHGVHLYSHMPFELGKPQGAFLLLSCQTCTKPQPAATHLPSTGVHARAQWLSDAGPMSRGNPPSLLHRLEPQ